MAVAVRACPESQCGRAQHSSRAVQDRDFAEEARELLLPHATSSHGQQASPVVRGASDRLNHAVAAVHFSDHISQESEEDLVQLRVEAPDLDGSDLIVGLVQDLLRRDRDDLTDVERLHAAAVVLDERD